MVSILDRAVYTAGAALAALVNGLIIHGAREAILAVPVAALIALFASLTILFALETFRCLELGDGFAIESHWGGLGGGLGGWRISRPLMFLIATLVCAGLSFAVANPHLKTDPMPALTAAAPVEQPETAAEDQQKAAAPTRQPGGNL